MTFPLCSRPGHTRALGDEPSEMEIIYRHEAILFEATTGTHLHAEIKVKNRFTQISQNMMHI